MGEEILANCRRAAFEKSNIKLVACWQWERKESAEKEKKRKAELSNLHTKYIVAYSKRIYYKATLIEASQERKTIYLLSDNLWFMVRFRFKGTVIRPKVNTVGNARDSSFVNLPCVSLSRRKL